MKISPFVFAVAVVVVGDDGGLVVGASVGISAQWKKTG
jgi:hypothetical protein